MPLILQREVCYLEGMKKPISAHFLNLERNNAVQELFAYEDYIVVLTVQGVCTAYNKSMPDPMKMRYRYSGERVA